MPCSCHNKLDNERDVLHLHLTQPNEFCLYCAEKHVGSAASMAREIGYVGEYVGYIAGELQNAAWHLAGGGAEDQALADKIRELRIGIQDREFDVFGTEFGPVLRELGRLIDADIAAAKVKEEVKEDKTGQKEDIPAAP